MPSIFDNPDNRMSNKSFKWEKIGDKLEGTLVGKRSVIIQDNNDNNVEKLIYEIKTPDGEFWNVWDKPSIRTQMERVKLGQIIGFEFVEERPNKRNPGLNKAKIIQVWSNAKIVDEGWIKEHREEAIDESTVIDEPTSDESGVDSLVSDPNAFSPNEETSPVDLREEINKLAMLKLGITIISDIPVKVMERTGIAYIEENFPRILEALKQL